MNPIRFEEDPSRPGHVGSVVFEKTRLEGQPGHQVAVGTGQTETIKASLVLKSIGYKSLAVTYIYTCHIATYGMMHCFLFWHDW